MGHIKEPVDFFVENKPVSLADKQAISAVIKAYKAAKKKRTASKTSVRAHVANPGEAV